MNTQTSSELLPCPFCGAKASSGRIFGSRWVVFCPNIDLENGCAVKCETAGHATIEAATDAWNRRTVPAEKRVTDLAEALTKAVSAAEYVVMLVEDTGACGDSPNPAVRSDWLGTAMHCYAAMNFVSGARAALAAWENPNVLP